MKKVFLSLIFLLLVAIPTIAQNTKVNGTASKGGKIIRTSATVQHIVMETYPNSTVTVYNTGTLTLASIFTNETGTPKSNPFTAGSDASYSFYVAPGRYDINFSGTGIISPFTISDIFVATGSGGGGAVTSVFGRTGAVIYQTGDVPFTGLNFVGSNLASLETRSATDLTSGTLPDARFPAVLPAVSGISLTNLNASNIASGTLSDTRLSSNIPRLNSVNTFTQNNIFTANVGINTTTPDRRLEILDGSGAQLRLTSTDGGAFTDLFVDSGGTFNIIPTGNVTFDSTGNQVNPLNNFDQNLGQINKKWLSLHAAELFVETLVAQNTIATIGGRIVVAPTNILIADLSSIATTINVKYNNLANGDRVYMEGNSSIEFMAVTSGASVIPGGFSYTVTRNLDGTGANDWFAGDAVLNTGVSGDGFIDLYSVRGIKSATQVGPTIVGNVRNSTTFNDFSERWAIGNLNGLYDYGTDIYGAAFGVPTGSWIKIDPTNGVRIGNNATTKIQLDAAGNATFSGTITAAAGSIAGWTINSTNLNNGTTYLASGLNIPAGQVAWFGRSATGYQGINLNDGSNRFISMIVGDTDTSNWPYLAFNDGTRYRLVLGALNKAWGTDGSTASMGMKIWDSSGNKLVEFSNVQNVIGGIIINSTSLAAGNTVISPDGINLSTVTSGGKASVAVSSRITWTPLGGSITGELLAYRQSSTSTNTTEIWSHGNTTTDTNGVLLLAASSDETENANSAYIRVFGNGSNTRSYVTIHGNANFKGVTIGTNSVPTTSAVLDLNTTTGAFLPPRLTTTERDALTPTDGMLIYNTTTGKHQARSAGAWVDLY